VSRETTGHTALEGWGRRGQHPAVRSVPARTCFTGRDVGLSRAMSLPTDHMAMIRLASASEKVADALDRIDNRLSTIAEKLEAIRAQDERGIQDGIDAGIEAARSDARLKR
jgi:hypothetical protein